MLWRVTAMVAFLFFLANARPGVTQSDIVLREVSEAIKEWNTEKNKLLAPLGISVEIDPRAAEFFAGLYGERANKYLAQGDQAYTNIGGHLTGRPAVNYLDRTNFYDKVAGATKMEYASSNWVAPQVRRNTLGMLDQYLIVQLAQMVGSKRILLRREFIEKFSRMFDDCELPPKTRLWCKH